MAQIAPPVPLTTQPRRLATNRDRSRQSTQTTAEAGPQAILSRGAVASKPRAVAPGAPARGLPFWRWCSLRSETAWFRAHSRLWRLVVRARPLARIAPSQARDTTPAALPRSHRRRLLPPLPPAPPLRPRPPRRKQPLAPSKRAPPVSISHYRPRPCRLARTCSTRSLSRCHATYLRTRCCRLARRSVPWTCAMSCRYRYSPASSRPASPYARRRRILSLRET